jgi:hypothetical protein
MGIRPLAQLFLDACPSDHPVALNLDPGGAGVTVRTWAEFARAAAWTEAKARG